MNLVQRVLSMLLYNGHASKQLFRRLQRLLLSLSHTRTIAFLDKLGKGHDGAALSWKAAIEQESSSVRAPQEHLPEETLEEQEQSSSGPGVTRSEEEPRPTSPDSMSITSQTTVTDASIDSVQSPEFSSLSSDFLMSSDEEFDIFGDLKSEKPKCTLPTFKLVGDNLDKSIHPRDMRIDSQTQSMHYFHMYAVRDRVNVSEKSDFTSLPDVSSANLSLILPSEQDQRALKKTFSILIARTLKKCMKFFKVFGSGLERHIVHERYEEMSQKSEVVPLGVLLKNETSHEDMVAIMDHLHQYVPTFTKEDIYHDTETGDDVTVPVDHFHQILIGGDQLTVAHAKGSQRICRNSSRGIERLEGLSPVVEDWHAKMCFLGVIWKRLYRCSSATDGGTLFQLRNVINHRNVVRKPERAVTQCEEFFLLVAEAHIISAAMTLFGMKSIDDKPPNTDVFPAGCEDLDSLQRRQVLVMASERIVEEHVDISFPTTSGANTSINDHKEDRILTYAREALTLGLFLMEFVDAVREGDGNRIIRCWRFFLLMFKATNRKNYAIEAFTLLSQFHFFFSERMKQQLLWSRTVNIHGHQGKNVSMDLHMEHLNKECKSAIAGLGANVTEGAVKRVGKCLGEMMKVCTNFDDKTGVCHESEHHTTRSEQKDRDTLIQQLVQSKVFEKHTGRKHRSFPNFKQNVMQKLDMEKLQDWMREKFQKQRMTDSSSKQNSCRIINNMD